MKIIFVSSTDIKSSLYDNNEIFLILRNIQQLKVKYLLY